jgi:hypothetical protein
LLANGSLVLDPIGDVGCGSGYCDVSSAAPATLSSVFWASDGVNVFFRLRVLGDPGNPSAGGFKSTAYVLQIAVAQTLVAAVGLDGKPAKRDFVYVANADGTAHSEIYAYPFDSSGGRFSAAARSLPDGTGHFFVDWQVPIARITERTGGAVTGSTPVQLFFGTSQAANLSVINKDFMIGNSVDFGGGSTIVFVPPAVASNPTIQPRSVAAPPAPTTQPPPAPAGSSPRAPATPALPLLPDTAVAVPPLTAPAQWLLGVIGLLCLLTSVMRRTASTRAVRPRAIECRPRLSGARRSIAGSAASAKWPLRCG